ncbi:hypothetical protein HDU96_008130, partial [Phlyctochytrium bullatum]
MLMPQLFFFFQKKKYRYDEDKKVFVKLQFPYADGRTVSYYSQYRGLKTGHQIKETLDIFGQNKSVKCQDWVQIQTDELLPGDICSVLRSKDECPVPADLLVLDGSCIANEAMLSGESTPQLKEAIRSRDPTDVFDIEADKNSVLFGGTKVLQVTTADTVGLSKPPDLGCVATERITANNLESLLFILFLLIFAIIAAGYVWVEGSKNEERKRSKVLLDCILIITSVVPPELPMELSLAVNNSLIALAKCYVYCTEPFRIPFAGKVDIACFDKTGTLTTENLIVEGVTGLGDDRKAIITKSIPKETTRVLASAHSLVVLEDGVVGDPMEKNTLEYINWNLSKDGSVSPTLTKEFGGMKILRRYQFSSALKRMSSISSFTSSGDSSLGLFVAVKGAPETLRGMYTTVPKDYDDIYKYWARRGSRVLALGYKFLPNEYSKKCVMITGDNALTACHVAKEVTILSKDVLIGEERGEDDGTNDVGALKQAHVGIALLDGKKEDIEKLNAIGAARRQKYMLEQQAAIREKWGLPTAPQPQQTGGQEVKDNKTPDQKLNEQLN